MCFFHTVGESGTAEARISFLSQITKYGRPESETNDEAKSDRVGDRYFTALEKPRPKTPRIWASSHPVLRRILLEGEPCPTLIT